MSIVLPKCLIPVSAWVLFCSWVIVNHTRITEDMYRDGRRDLSVDEVADLLRAAACVAAGSGVCCCRKLRVLLWEAVCVAVGNCVCCCRKLWYCCRKRWVWEEQAGWSQLSLLPTSRAPQGAGQAAPVYGRQTNSEEGNTNPVCCPANR